MVYSLTVKTSAERDFKKLPKHIASKIADSIENILVNNPGIDKELSGKKFKGLFSFRINDYRVIYTINHELKIIDIILLSHRKEVYKILEKRL